MAGPPPPHATGGERMPAVYLDVELYTGRQPVAVVSAQLPAPLGNDPEGVRKMCFVKLL